jgi:Cu-Zn family superoxide dismutase
MKILVLLIVMIFTFKLYASDNHNHSHSNLKKLVAVMNPSSGSRVSGTVTFTILENGKVKVEATITNLTPGKHGIHIHEYGDCSDAKAMSAGGHYAGEHKEHSSPESTVRHLGDLGNIEANAEGIGKLSYIDEAISKAGLESIVGRGVIIHEKEDDLKTQPTGNAGGRVACGTIGVTKI